MHVAVLVLIAAALRPPPADTVPRADTVPSVDTAPRALACDSAALRTPLAGATDTLVLTLRRADGSATPLPSPWAERTLEAIARHLVLPRPVPLPVWGILPSRAPGAAGTVPDTIVRTISNAALATVTAAGRLEGEPALAASSLDGGIDAALLGAVRAADRARALAPAPVEAGVGPGEALRVVVGLGTAGRDVNRAAGPAGADARPAARATSPVTTYPVELVRRDRLVLTEPPGPAASGRPGPRYPKKELKREQEGSTAVEYVLDERGVPVAGTLLAVRYTGWAFARAALDFLPGARFTPGRVAGCAVPMLVRQPFAFRMEP